MSEVSEFPPKNSFVSQLRKEIMKMHPRGGPKRSFSTTTLNFYQFLVNSKLVFETIENIINTNDFYEKLRNLEFERKDQIEADLQYLEREFPNDITSQRTTQFAGTEFAQVLKELEDSPPEFLCYAYTIYFAHFAGGTMIGKTISNELFNGHPLNFYLWNVDVEELKLKVRTAFDEICDHWTDQEKAACTQTIPETYIQNGNLLNILFPDL